MLATGSAPDGKVELGGAEVRDNRQRQVEQLGPDRAHGKGKKPRFPVASKRVVGV